jgi:stage II sporulation protein B
MNKAKMTFRFDQPLRRDAGLERKPKEQQIIPLHKDEYKVSLIDAQTLNPYTNDFGGWQSSFDTETLRVEKLIRESGSQSIPPAPTFSNHEEIPMPREGIRREHTDPIRDHHWYVPEDHTYVRQRIGTSWLKVTAAVAGAIATGVAFGFLVLSMFSEESQANKGIVKDTAPSSITTVANTPKPGIAGNGAPIPDVAMGSATAKTGTDKPLAIEPPASLPTMAPLSTAASTEAATTVSIPAKTLTLLQSGVYSTTQGADAAQAELKKQGLAAVSDSGDRYPVYVALTLNRDEASGLAQQFQQKKIDVIVKSVELPALTRIKWSGKQAEAVPAFIAQGDKLIQLIVPLISKQLTESKLSVLDAPALQSAKTAHQTWMGMTTGVNEGINQEGQMAVQKMNSALNMAFTSLDEYKKNPSTSYLWQTQNSLIQAALAQKEFRKIIAAP